MATKLLAVTDIRTYDDNGEPEPMSRDEMEVCQHCGKRIVIVYEVEIDSAVKLIGSECYTKLTGSKATKAQISVAMQVPAAREIVKVLHADNANALCQTWTFQQRMDYWKKFDDYSDTARRMAEQIYYQETK